MVRTTETRCTLMLGMFDRFKRVWAVRLPLGDIELTGGPAAHQDTTYSVERAE